MDCIKVICDEDFGLQSVQFDNPRKRLSARGIIVNSDKKVAILNKVNKNEYKLIGGKIEKGETPEAAFLREALEETGCDIIIHKLLGYTEELKSLDNFEQKSYVFLAYVKKDNHVLKLTKKEIDEGSELLWLDLDEAIKLIKKSEKNIKASKYESIYHTKFIVRRDYEILKFYKKGNH